MFVRLLCMGCLVGLAEAKPLFQVEAEVNVGVLKSPGFKAPTDTLEVWGANWHARRLETQAALAWESLPDFFALHFLYQNQAWSAEFRAPLRMDASSWLSRSLGSMIPYSPDHLDINVPKTAFVRWTRPKKDADGVWLGRFTHPQKDEMSVSFAPIAPVDGLYAQHSMGLWVVRMSGLSLNPWLIGDPKDQSGEWALQQNGKAAPNQHDRVFVQPYKTLLSHEIVWQGRWIGFGLRELSLIGGKIPTLRDASPLAFWHNNYGDGYTNSLFAFLGRLGPWRGLECKGEWAIDEISAGSGEQSQEQDGIFGTLLSLSYTHDFAQSKLRGEVDWVHTAAGYGAHPLPLLRMSQRVVSRSNSQDIKQPGYYDTYIADLPIGYALGPDHQDLWFRMQWQRQHSQWESWWAQTRFDGLDLMGEHQPKQTEYLMGLRWGLDWKAWNLKLGVENRLAPQAHWGWQAVLQWKSPWTLWSEESAGGGEGP